MYLEQIKIKITELAQKHAAINEDKPSDFDDAEYLESQAIDMIIAYCEDKGYLINGFPTEKRKLDIEELDDEDYFSKERFHLYLDILTYQKEDVAELTWYFTDSFWQGTFATKQEFINGAKDRVECGGFYDVTL